MSSEKTARTKAQAKAYKKHKSKRVGKAQTSTYSKYLSAKWDVEKLGLRSPMKLQILEKYKLAYEKEQREEKKALIAEKKMDKYLAKLNEDLRKQRKKYPFLKGKGSRKFAVEMIEEHKMAKKISRRHLRRKNKK